MAHEYLRVWCGTLANRVKTVGRCRFAFDSRGFAVVGPEWHSDCIALLKTYPQACWAEDYEAANAVPAPEPGAAEALLAENQALKAELAALQAKFDAASPDPVISVPVGVVTAEVDPGPDGELGTDDDVVTIGGDSDDEEDPLAEAKKLMEESKKDLQTKCDEADPPVEYEKNERKAVLVARLLGLDEDWDKKE